MNPLVSIVTVVYNDYLNIETTLKSVVDQTYSNVEYIIIDGGSTDGTVETIEKYSNRISFWCTEKDNGIYDAMNKGLSKANGDWILFLNSGDKFVDTNTLSLIGFSEVNDNVSILYGNIILSFKYGKVKKKMTVNANSLPEIFHQSTFVKTKLHKKYPFELRYKYCSDYNSILSVYKEANIVKYLDLYISEYDMSGYSANNVYNYYLERSAVDNNFNKFESFKFYLKYLIRNLSADLYDYLYFNFLKYKNRNNL